MNGRKILLGVLGLFVIGAAVAVILWNKPHAKVEDQQSTAITAVALKQAYEKDEAAANKLYLNKVLEVSGTVSGLDKNQDGGSMLLLDTGDPSDEIQCTLRDKGAQAAKGAAVRVKGFCTGSNLLGITLTDCVISSN